MDEKALKELERESDKEIAQIAKQFDRTVDDALTNQAKKAIDQALMEMFGTRRKADDAKKIIIEALQKSITQFNSDLSQEFHRMMKEQKEEMRASIKKTFEDMRGEFMSELKNL